LLRVLLVEDNDGDADIVQDALLGAVSSSVEVARVERLQTAADFVKRERFDVVLLDLSLPDAKGLDGLHRLREMAPSAPIVVLTGLLDPNAGTLAIQEGAQDFLRKDDIEGPSLLRSIRYARERQEYLERTRLLADVGGALASSRDPAAMLTALSDALTRSYADRCSIEGAAETDSTPDDHAVLTGPGRLYSSLEQARLEVEDHACLAGLLGQDLRSAVVVPFHAIGRTPGKLTLARGPSSQPYGLADVGIIEEITRRAVSALDHVGLLAAAQRERKRAEVASRLKDEFLATLSHELRTPLTAVLGWTQLLRAGVVKVEDRERALETIERNVKSQVSLIEDVLDVSRIITGKLRLNIGTVELGRVLEAAVDTVRPAAEAKGVELQVELDPEAGIPYGDSDRLQQIVWNLLSNAVKFTPRGGRVLVRLQRRDAAVEVVVTDTGRGIASDFLEHAFERFRQADASLTRSHSGLGLGLAISRHLAELHGGTIRAESTGVGEGSTFTVRLPVAPLAPTPSVEHPVSAPSEPSHVTGENPPGLAGLSILVVDDEPDTREFLRAVFVQGDAVVTLASSAAEAFAALRAHPPDLLVSDIGMPDETGYDLIRRVRALPPGEGGHTPAIALTAYARSDDRTRTLEAGFDHNVTKPVEPTELLAVVVNIARRRLART
jgi:signal transduction histidine kinase/DNA-binding response OmpR family regulator